MHYSVGHVLCGTRGGGLGECRVRHIGPNRPEEIPQPPNDWPDIRGLSQLQASRETWLNGDAIELSMKSYHEDLPTQTRNIIHLVDTSIAGIFDRDERGINNLLKGRYDRFFRRFTQTEYTIWPCNFNDIHWELAVIHKGRSDPNSDKWDQILQVAVIDHWKDDNYKQRNDIIANRLRRIFTRIGFTIAAACERVVWPPWQKDSWSCGLRAFWTAKQMMDRINDGVARNTGYDEQLWAPLNPWFNPDQVRWEMIGLNAYEAVKGMNYKARVAVELVGRVLNSSGKLRDAGDVMRPPPRGSRGSPDKDHDSKKPPEGPDEGDDSGDSDDDIIEIPPEVFKKRAVAIPVPNERRVAPSWPIKQGDRGTGRRGERNNSVWPRSNAGNPPVQSTSNSGRPAVLAAKRDQFRVRDRKFRGRK
ncbi:uncharacterized protein GGS22DRAFT_128898 [Annulohypoxylon maeteangense]|uniref:uncharacterized protein n=1 Tax=Annulohypoxylon maeteangense TaxID=1927788 RepID=UPI002007B837|nr:uncharacterized protein GGS22DRAFT_128898 [Annulohypoxylon maeteangense]KAI0886450.1 hypothetical protein GGS22DRAFT_128898 [Annulohypoxylon maeteangense]